MNESILNIAISTAKRSECFPYKVGAVIFKGKVIISTGHNQTRSAVKINSRYKRFISALHAEQHAVFFAQSKKSFKNASILVVRLNRSGNLSLAKPCSMCEEMLRVFGINKIYYSDRSGLITFEKLGGSGNVNA